MYDYMIIDCIEPKDKIFTGYNYSQLCCVEGEKERERMMQNENRTQLLTIIITMSHDS
jgi:hypothetical protein